VDLQDLRLLAYVDAESCRRAIKWMRNLQEGRHGLAKHVFHGRRGGLREPYHAVMEDQLGALGLVINVHHVVEHVGLDAALFKLRADGYLVFDADVARPSPYLYAHIDVHGNYTFQPPNLPGGRRALRDPDAANDERYFA
jgi:Tn3 transposase DDE domain